MSIYTALRKADSGIYTAFHTIYAFTPIYMASTIVWLGDARGEAGEDEATPSRCVAKVYSIIVWLGDARGEAGEDETTPSRCVE